MRLQHQKSITDTVVRRARRLERHWQKLCGLYLPVPGEGSIWVYHHRSSAGRAFGWKLHVSATILNAPTILERIAPLLVESGVQFKAPRSLTDLGTLNSGLLQTYTQVGKVFTIYPHSDEEAVTLATRLDDLTRRFKAPSVPFDLRLSEGSNVYYRYGAFKNIDREQADTTAMRAGSSGNGNLDRDDRK